MSDKKFKQRRCVGIVEVHQTAAVLPPLPPPPSNNNTTYTLIQTYVLCFSSKNILKKWRLIRYSCKMCSSSRFLWRQFQKDRKNYRLVNHIEKTDSQVFRMAVIKRQIKQRWLCITHTVHCSVHYVCVCILTNAQRAEKSKFYGVDILY